MWLNAEFFKSQKFQEFQKMWMGFTFLARWEEHGINKYTKLNASA